MEVRVKLLNSIVAAFVLAVAPLAAQEASEGDGLDDLFAALLQAEAAAAEALVEKISTEWSKSGSASMDFLLQRGREAMEKGDMVLAVQHFSALIDHAPDFAEGYNGRATAYFQLDRYGPALDDIRMVLTLNPRHFGAMTGLALILEEMDRPARALEAWAEVRRLYPASPQADQAVTRLETQIEGRSL